MHGRNSVVKFQSPQVKLKQVDTFSSKAPTVGPGSISILSEKF